MNKTLFQLTVVETRAAKQVIAMRDMAAEVVGEEKAADLVLCDLKDSMLANFAEFVFANEKDLVFHPEYRF